VRDVPSKAEEKREMNLNKPIFDSHRNEESFNILAKDELIKKENLVIRDSSKMELQNISEEANLKIVEAAADEELNKAIASRLDPAWLKRELEGAN